MSNNTTPPRETSRRNRALAGPATLLFATLIAVPPASAAELSKTGLVEAGNHVQSSVSARAVEGKVIFDCLLMPFRSGFRYETSPSVVAARATEGDPGVAMSASFDDLPGIAPVPIENGQMTVVVKGTANGQKFSLTGSSTVNADPKAQVPAPPVTGVMESSESDLRVELTEFGFKFGEMMGLLISATCLPTVGGDLGTVAVGDGSLDQIGRETAARDAEASDRKNTQLDTAEGSLFVVIGMGITGAGVFVAGLLVWLSRSRMRRT